MNIDHELHHALRREQAPPDLVDGILNRIRHASQDAPAAGPKRDPIATPAQRHSTRVRGWLAGAAVLAVTVVGADRYRTQQQAAEAARVERELRLALQITSDTLARVQSKFSQPAEGGSR
jgi:hypothetical protein